MFPLNHKHGDSSCSLYYKETLDVLSISPITDSYLDQVFRKTTIYSNLINFGYTPYIQWRRYKYSIYIAYPKINVFYDDKSLKYYHIPKVKDVLFDFEIKYGISIPRESYSLDQSIVDTRRLEGNYIVNLGIN